MYHERSGDLVIARLDDSRYLMDSLDLLAGEHGLRGGIILTGVGMLREFELGYFDSREYRRLHVTEPCELVSMNGTLAISDGKPFFHIHASLARSDHTLIGGHLFSGTINVTLELALMAVDGPTMERVPNDIGLTDLVITR